jgi:outer membrane protein assembly factor BamB
MVTRLTWLMVGVVAWMALAAHGADWTHFRCGPANDGLSAERGLLASWPEGGPVLMWQRQGLSDGNATPVVADGTVFLASAARGTGLLALDLADGAERWRAPASAGSASPAISGPMIFVQGRGIVQAYQRSTGKLVWSTDVLKLLPPTDWKDRTRYDSLAGSPVAADGKVFWVCGHPQSPVVALDQQTGALAWASTGSKEASCRGWSSPNFVEYRGRKLLIAQTAWHLLVIDAEDGRVLHERELFPTGTGRQAGNSLGNVPVFADGMIYCSSAYGGGATWTTWRLTAELALEQAWNSPAIAPFQESMVCLDGKIFGRGELCWEDVDGNPDVVVNGRRFAEVSASFRPRGAAKPGKRTAVQARDDAAKTALHWSRTGLMCQDVRTGKVLGYRTDIASDCAFCGPVMAAADGKLYMQWSWGQPRVYLLDADAGMAVRGTVNLPIGDIVTNLKGSQPWIGFSTPVVADGKLIVRYGTGLYVFNIRDADVAAIP